MDETKKEVVTIQGIENKYIESIGVSVYTLHTDQGDFQFWEKKKDGGQTKAMEQFQQFRFIAGDRVEVVYKEQDASYNNKKTGARINKVNKNVVFFVQSDENTPNIHPNATQINHSTTTPIKQYETMPYGTIPSGQDFEILLKEIQELKDRVEILEEFNGLKEKKEEIPVIGDDGIEVPF